MLDVLLRGARVVDGTGAPARRRRHPRRAHRAVGHGRRARDAHRRRRGLVVAPGFVDIHTHYDAQVLWDPLCTPSPFHGVTTVVGGNCGFTIAPLGDGNDVEYVMRMMAASRACRSTRCAPGPGGTGARSASGSTASTAARGERGVPRRPLDHAPVVMGEAAHDASTSEQIAAMVATRPRRDGEPARSGCRRRWARRTPTATANPVPSRAASTRGAARARGRGARPRGHDARVHRRDGRDPRRAHRAHDRHVARREPTAQLEPPRQPVAHRGVRAAAHVVRPRHARTGAHVVALTLPDLMRVRADRVLDDLPGGATSCAARRRTAGGARSPTPTSGSGCGRGPTSRAARGPRRRRRNRTCSRSPTPDGSADGRSLDRRDRRRARRRPDRRAHRRRAPRPPAAHDGVPVARARRSVAPTRAGRCGAGCGTTTARVLGGSDAGAHVDLMCHANYPTMVLGESVRERKLLTLEEAVHQLTDVPARLYGLRDRGRVADGWHADLVVFDPDTIGSRPPQARPRPPGWRRASLGRRRSGSRTCS